MKFWTYIILILFLEACGPGKVTRLTHPKDSIIKIDNCAKDRGLIFYATSVDILMAISDAEKDPQIGKYENACKEDDANIRKALMCLYESCDKLPKSTTKTDLINLVNNCNNEIDRLLSSSSSCGSWVNKVFKNAKLKK